VPLKSSDEKKLGERATSVLTKNGLMLADGEHMFIPPSLENFYNKLLEDSEALKELTLDQIDGISLTEDVLDFIGDIFSEAATRLDTRDELARKADNLKNNAAKGWRELMGLADDFEAFLERETLENSEKLLPFGEELAKSYMKSQCDTPTYQKCDELEKSKEPGSYHDLEKIYEEIGIFSGEKCDAKAKLDREFLNDLGVMTTLNRRSSSGDMLYKILHAFKNLHGYTSTPTEIPTKIFMEPLGLRIGLCVSIGYHLKLRSTLMFNSASFHATNAPNTRGKTKLMEKSREALQSWELEVVAKTVTEIMCHELGHFYHFIRLRKELATSLDALENKFTKKIKDPNDPTKLTPFGEKIKKQVSAYALTNVFEFVAEVFTKIMNGTSDKIDMDLMKAYREFYGPKDPKIRLGKDGKPTYKS
jgi:hypothetical protein